MQPFPRSPVPPFMLLQHTRTVHCTGFIYNEIINSGGRSVFVLFVAPARGNGKRDALRVCGMRIAKYGMPFYVHCVLDVLCSAGSTNTTSSASSAESSRECTQNVACRIAIGIFVGCILHIKFTRKPRGEHQRALGKCLERKNRLICVSFKTIEAIFSTLRTSYWGMIVAFGKYFLFVLFVNCFMFYSSVSQADSAKVEKTFLI